MYQKNRGKVIKPVLEKLIFVRVNKCEKVKSEFGFKLEREEKIKKIFIQQYEINSHSY